MPTCWLLTESKCNKGNLYSQNVDFVFCSATLLPTIWLLLLLLILVTVYLLYECGRKASSLQHQKKSIGDENLFTLLHPSPPFFLFCRWLVLFGCTTWRKLLNYWIQYFLCYVKSSLKCHSSTCTTIHSCLSVHLLDWNILQVRKKISPHNLKCMQNE